PAAEHLVEPSALDRACAPGVADRAPESPQRFLSALASAVHQPIGHDHSIHRAGRGTANPVDLNPVLGQKPIEHTPGERPVSAAALKAEIDPLGGK
ncbi:MAG TPA: hypothetical protein VF258_00315, partial [Luteolibacter sp.]